MTFFGSSDFRKRAAIEADKNGIKLHDPDLKKYVEERNAKLKADREKQFKKLTPFHIRASLEKAQTPKITPQAPELEIERPKFKM